MAGAPLVRFALPDGRPASLLVGEGSSVLAVEELLVSSWDLLGRPYALVREDGTYRRGLDGRLLWKREASAAGPPEAAEAARRLRAVVAMNALALERDVRAFLAASGPVGILPPDQYLALVVRVTEGCSWNACGFCSLYRDVPFRFKPEPELRAHIAALRAFFGESIALRRSVFLGDANALCLDDERLLPLLRVVAAAFPGAPLCSFVDAWTGRRRSAAAWRECRGLGLRRVYLGLETGDAGLYAWLGKPGAPQDALGRPRVLLRVRPGGEPRVPAAGRRRPGPAAAFARPLRRGRRRDPRGLPSRRSRPAAALRPLRPRRVRVLTPAAGHRAHRPRDGDRPRWYVWPPRRFPEIP